jgi:hypothetical protein
MLLPSKYGAALRSSPIICGINTLFILKEWIFLIIPAGSPLKAAKLWAEFRFQDIDEGREIEGSFSNLQKNTFFRIAIFVVGALPQIVKLYAMQGLLWTQLASAAYLASFVAIELLTFLASFDAATREPRAPRRPTDNEYAFGYLTITYSVLFAFYLYALGFVAATKPYVDKLSWWHFPHIYISLLVISIYVLVTMIAIYRRSRPEFALLLCMISWMLMMPIVMGASSGMGSASYGITSFIPSKDDVTKYLPKIGEGRIWVTIAAAISAHFALGLAFMTGKAIVETFKGGRKKLLDLGSQSLFVILHVVASILYFKFDYDPMETNKPGWTDVLG